MPIFVIQKKETKTSEKRNCRITIIFKDEIMIEKFRYEYIARDTIKKNERNNTKSRIIRYIWNRIR